MKKATKDTIQWHPAFQASIQIEFEAEAEKLTFEPEHLLSKKPMQMDELTITFICNHFPRKMVQHLFEGISWTEHYSCGGWNLLYYRGCFSDTAFGDKGIRSERKSLVAEFAQ